MPTGRMKRPEAATAAMSCPVSPFRSSPPRKRGSRGDRMSVALDSRFRGNADLIDPFSFFNRPNCRTTAEGGAAWPVTSVRCISGSSSSAPATTRPAGAMRAPFDQPHGTAGDAGDRPHRRARQVRPAVHLRLDGDGPHRPSLVPVPLRADDADHRAQRLRPRMSGSAPRSRPASPSRSTSPASSARSTTSAAAAPPGTSSPAPTRRRRSTSAWTSTSSTSCATQRANEFVDVVTGLWDCWEDGAIVADKATGRYIDAGKVRPLDHQGRFFKVRGPINMARCPQGHPVIIQAGGSPSGLELAARTADVVFSVVQELEPAKKPPMPI